MRTARTFEEFEDGWEACLAALEKTFVKLQRAGKALDSTFEPWLGQYRKLRGKDQLLVYLKQARHADHHSLQDSIKHEPGSYSFSIPGGPGVTHIESLRIEDGRVVEYKGNRPPIVEVTPSRITLVPVKNRGRKYKPPKKHVGGAVAEGNPLEAAEAGLRFYRELVEDAKQRFGISE